MKEKRIDDITTTKCDDLSANKVKVVIKKVTTKKPHPTPTKENVASLKK